MSGKSDWVAFSTADFLVGTTELTNDEVGVYIRLLCLQHQRGVLPADLGQLNRLVPGAKRAWPALASKFVACGDGIIRNERMARECEAAASRMEFYKERAKVAADRRWSGSQGPRQGSQRGCLKHASSSASSMPQAMLEASPKQCLSDAKESREEKNPPTLSGGRGVGGDGESPPEASQPGLALVRTLHRSADDARRRLVRVRGEQQGEADFDGAIETRLRQATRKLTELGVDEEQAHHIAERTLTLWHWEQWSDTLNAIALEAKGKQSPAGWLRWRIEQDGGTSRQSEAATA